MERDLVNQLVRRIGKGDEDAFEELYRELHPPLYSFVQPYLYRGQTAEDVIERTFEVVIDKSRTKLTYTNCLAWIFEIAKNKARRAVKADLCESPVDFNEETQFALEDGRDFVERLAVKEAVGKLPPVDQAMVRLRFWNHCTFSQIADVVKMSESSVKRRLQCIVNRLGILLKEDA